MLNITHVLEYGEYFVEHYRVQLTELLGSGWARSAPWLQTIITNRRLILMPETDTTSSPIVISLPDIDSVWNVGLGRRDGVVLSMKNGEKLHMLVDWNEGRRMKRDTQMVMALKPDYSPHYVL